VNVIHLLPDDFHGQERLAKIRAGCGDPESVALNTTKLEGPRLPLDELVAAAAAMPFLADMRLVVVRKLLAQADRQGEDGERRRGRAQQDHLKAIAEWLPQLPPTTELIFLEEKVPARTSTNPVVQAIVRLGGEIFESPKLQPEAVQEWILRRVAAKGGRISRDAAAVLAETLRDDLGRINQEVEKLITYAAEGEVSPSDVRLLVIEAREENVFRLVDAVGMRDRRQALSVLHELLREGTPVQVMLAMVARQLRLLLQVREQMGKTSDQGVIAGELGLRPWQVRNLVTQARRFGAGDLERAYHQLLGTDQSIKTGRLEPEVAADLLVAGLTAR
jgi:DNA polymerase-3 subunit delta